MGDGNIVLLAMQDKKFQKFNQYFQILIQEDTFFTLSKADCTLVQAFCKTLHVLQPIKVEAH